jgi:uncharacterized protein (DUF2236 family)
MTEWRRISAWLAPRLFWAACALAGAFALWSRPAPACEICVEDHVAATYDYAVVAKAEAAGQKVLFVAVRGKDAAAPASEAAIRRALAAMAGVDRASVRYSAFPSAASFAWSAKRISSADLLRTVNGGLGGSGLTLVALKVIG